MTQGKLSQMWRSRYLALTVFCRRLGKDPKDGELCFRMAGVEQLYQVKRMMRGIGNVFVLDLFSNLKWVRSSGYFGDPLGQVITLRGPF